MLFRSYGWMDACSNPLLSCSDLQMWMNAREAMVGVPSCVSIQMALTHAVATMATYLEKMLPPVKVNTCTYTAANPCVQTTKQH